MVPITVISRDEYRRQLSTVTLTAVQEEAFHAWNDGLALWRMAPTALSGAQSASVSADWVGAFYSVEDKAITIVDWGYPLDSRGMVALLVHEYEHAIQDARFDLAARYQQAGNDNDHALALSAIIEGEATYVGDRAAIGLFGDVPSDVPWDTVYRTWQKNSRRDALSTPLPIQLEWRQFPYAFGSKLVDDAIKARGWAGADQLFENPSSGAREILAGFGALEPAGGPWQEDLTNQAVPELPARYAFRAVDRMGAWIVGLLFERAGTEVATATAITEGLRGDAFSVFRDEATGGVVAFWRLRFSSTQLAQSAAEAASLLGQTRQSLLDRDLILIATSTPTSLDDIANITFQPAPTTSSPTPDPARSPLREVRCPIADFASAM